MSSRAENHLLRTLHLQERRGEIDFNGILTDKISAMESNK